jgi:energy-converting hydrogenase Eha subunit G
MHYLTVTVGIAIELISIVELCYSINDINYDTLHDDGIVELSKFM